MKRILLIFTGMLSVYNLQAQKSIIDSNAVNSWPNLSAYGTQINNSGKYFSYVIENYKPGKPGLIISSISGNWSRVYSGTATGYFCDDNMHFILQVHDSLLLVTLGTDECTLISTVKSWKWPAMRSGVWIAYAESRHERSVILENLVDKRTLRFSGVKEYLFDKSGRTFVISSDGVGQNSRAISLELIDLSNLKLDTIFEKTFAEEDAWSISGFNFDPAGHQLAFIVSEGAGSASSNSVWYYSNSLQRAIPRVNNASKGIEKGYLISRSTPIFSKNGKWIFFSLIYLSRVDKEVPSDAVMVDVWSYKDLVIQPEQTRELSEEKAYMAVVGNSDSSVVQLERGNGRVMLNPTEITGDYTVIMDNPTHGNYWWTLGPQPGYWIVSLNGKYKHLLRSERSDLPIDRSMTINNFAFSPNGGYLVYFDTYSHNYFSYNVVTCRTVDITKDILTGVESEYKYSLIGTAVAPIAAWDLRTGKALVYDNYDIWEVDLATGTSPRNITYGYGRKHGIKLRIIGQPGKGYGIRTFSGSEKLLISAFDPNNMYNGFFRLDLSADSGPKLLTLDPCLYYKLSSQLPNDDVFDRGMIPIKAGDTDLWMVRRETASEAPNLFVTGDFSHYKRVTSLNPQRNYNWLTTELITWKEPGGAVLKGILYKPENFDPDKKYPIIFNFYEELSQRLFEYPIPYYTFASINIPWFVSRGYMVCTPDIKYSVDVRSGVTAVQSAFSAVVSAAKYLSKRSYIDSNRMGIQGHSFGGMEAAYILTHTHLFAAAVECSGMTDPTSGYLTLVPFVSPIEHAEVQHLMERGHDLYGGSLWQRPDLFIQNSAVLRANQVTCPVLIMHNMHDNQIPWRQGVEFYMALRRCGKRVWLLQYDKSNHVVFGRDAIDFTTRLTQFFDYYLKNAQPPKWMTSGIPASLKGIDTGLEIDSTGQKP